MTSPPVDLDTEALNDRLAREHPIDDYYKRSPLPVRVIEQRRLSIIKQMAGDVTGLQLAEIGSGGGYVLRLFPSARLTAIDVSDLYLDNARRNLQGYDVRYVKGEVDKLDLPSQSFDRIICTEVLEHTKDPEAILATIARLLKPTGVAVITVPNDPLIARLKGVIRETPLGAIYKHKIEWGADEFHLHKWTPAEFEVLLVRHLRVLDRASAPSDLLPIRACFRCITKSLAS